MKKTLMLFLLLIVFIACEIKAEKLLVDNVELSVIRKGDFSKSKPTILLLSGPTDNWHSDLGWWVLGQNYLSESYPTLALERASQGFSQTIEKPSYTDFAKRLASYVKEQQSEFIIVAFASSNISVQIALQDKNVKNKIKGIVLLDPDVLTKHAIKHYSQDTEKYRKNWQQLSDYIKSGNYRERAADKVNKERQHLEAIIVGEYKKFMDWDLYGKYEELRKKDNYQWNKFKEITVYKDDLENAIATKFPADIPLVILDSDFETGYLSNIKDDAIKESIIKWRDEGKNQFFELTSHLRCSAYWPLDSQEHLLTFTELKKIKRAIERIEKCQP